MLKGKYLLIMLELSGMIYFVLNSEPKTKVLNGMFIALSESISQSVSPKNESCKSQNTIKNSFFVNIYIYIYGYV